MKQSPNSSGRDVSGRTDLQESRERVNPAHLVDLAVRSVGRSEVLIEKAVSWTAITRQYVSETRGFARWTGTTDKVVREITGPTGELSVFKFLWTTTRGVSSTHRGREGQHGVAVLLEYAHSEPQYLFEVLPALWPWGPGPGGEGGSGDDQE
jgi:hypothetical protein